MSRGSTSTDYERGLGGEDASNRVSRDHPYFRRGGLVMTVAVKFDGVRVSYGARRRSAGVDALTDVSLTIEAGERVAVVGRSGAGKSTIAKLACGLAKPSAGSVSIFGTDLSRASRRELRQLRHRMHLVFQDPYQSLHPGLRVGSLVNEPLAIAGRTDTSAVPDALARVGLTPPSQFMDRLPATLSGGQRQRVAIARAFVARPKLISLTNPRACSTPRYGQQLRTCCSSCRPNETRHSYLSRTTLHWPVK